MRDFNFNSNFRLRELGEDSVGIALPELAIDEYGVMDYVRVHIRLLERKQ